MTVLVLGNFPPVPGPVTAATVAEVRRLAADGTELRTASPRPSGAELVVRASGVRGGVRLDRARRRCGATRLVLAVADGVPVRALRRRGAATALDAVAALAGALAWRAAARRFEQVTLLVADDPGWPAPLWRLLWPVAHDVVVTHDAAAAGIAVPARLLRRVASPATLPGLVTGPGATALGPPEVRPHLMPRYVAGRVARRVLGPAFDPTWAAVRWAGRPAVRRLRRLRAR